MGALIIHAIPQAVLECVRIASQVTGELAKISSTDAALVTRLCTEFVNNIRVSGPAWHLRDA